MSAVEQDLAEFLAGDDPDYTTDPEPPQGNEDANRRLRRLARIRAEIADVDAQVRTVVEQAELWAADRKAVLEGRERWEMDGLEMWHRAVLADDPGQKTISLPCGTLKARVQQPEWVFDEAAFLEWATEHAPDLVRVPEPKPSIDKTAAKKVLMIPEDVKPNDGPTFVFAADGEIPPGVTVTFRDPKFTIETAAE